MPDPLTGKLSEAEILEHLDAGDRFDSYFKPPAGLLESSGTQLVPLGVEIPLWNAGHRIAHSSGNFFAFGGKLPEGMQANIDLQTPKTTKEKDPYIVVSGPSFYGLSLICQMICNRIPPVSEPLGPVIFDVFIPRIKPNDLACREIEVVLDKLACRDENNPCLTLKIHKSEILVDSKSSVQTIGTLASVEYNGRQLNDDKRIQKWLRRIGGRKPLDIAIVRRPEFMTKLSFSPQEIFSGLLPLPKQLPQLKAE